MGGVQVMLKIQLNLPIMSMMQVDDSLDEEDSEDEEDDRRRKEDDEDEEVAQEVEYNKLKVSRT